MDVDECDGSRVRRFAWQRYLELKDDSTASKYVPSSVRDLRFSTVQYES
jgi:hypothetical protein